MAYLENVRTFARVYELGSMSAAAVLTMLPTMVMFALASRWIVQGLTSGSVKE